MKISTYLKFVYVWLGLLFLITYLELIDNSNSDDSLSVMTSLLDKISHLFTMYFVITLFYFLVFGLGLLVFDFHRLKKNIVLILLPIVLMFLGFFISNLLDYYFPGDYYYPTKNLSGASKEDFTKEVYRVRHQAMRQKSEKHKNLITTDQISEFLDEQRQKRIDQEIQQNIDKTSKPFWLEPNLN